jgi:tRNA modification GTPase
LKTIVGIATPPGFGGIGIVRMSGADSLAILNKMFVPKSGHSVTPRHAALGTVSGKGYADTAIAVYFPAPHSFTGEDVVEIQSHGGWHLLNRIMKTAVKHGATPATNGEFTKTAFMNGKMSLDEAESIMDMINAESDAELSAASQIMSGALREKLDVIEKTLISIKAEIDAYLDYPDELDTPPIPAAQLKIVTEEQINKLLETAQTGQIIKNGVNVAIIGKPNAGKSSLFNALIKNDRSIVTDIAGTTTDAVSERMTYKGIKINFIDTAGIREGKNIIEREGIARAKGAASSADIVLAVLDSTTELNEFDKECLEIARPKKHIIIYNKSDINPAAGYAGIPVPPAVAVSAKTGQNIDKILDQIIILSAAVPPSNGTLVITNERHIRHLTDARDILLSLDTDALDKISADITSALNHIGQITGTNITESALNEIFSKFCLGK